MMLKPLHFLACAGLAEIALAMGVGFATLSTAHAADAPPTAPVKIDFNRDVRPILSETCFHCHGPDAKTREADLRLDVRAGLLGVEGEPGHVIPGKPAESELFQRITSKDPEEQMPPPASTRKLSAAQVATIKMWIEQGAEWKGHWAYIPPVRAEAPQVEVAGFTRGDIDRFLAAKFAEQRLVPSPSADPRTLVRRLSFDLLGLPPEVADVEAFAANPTDAAYAALVEKYLASPAFGERMAVFWLDQVRFGDTDGYHGDNHRDVWLYRDYVIDAFNRNVPFDQFTTEQLAGDLLEQPTDAQKVASGYNRMLMTTREGGAQAKEYLAKYAADRVRNASGVWLGATIGCAECHDHKYDPYTAKDFYSFAAFFADVQETAVGAQAQTAMPTPEEKAKLAALESQIAEVRKTLDAETPALKQAQAEWEAALAASPAAAWTTLVPTKLTSDGKAKLEIAADGTITAKGKSPDKDVYTFEFPVEWKDAIALRLEIFPDDKLPAKGPGRAANGNFVLNELEAELGGQKLAFSQVTATHSQDGWAIIGAIDGQPESGWAILNETGKPNHAVFELAANQGTGLPETLVIRLRFNYGSQHTLGRFRLSSSTAARPVTAGAASGVNPQIAALVALPADQRTVEEQGKVARYYRTIAPLLEPVRKEIAALEKQRDALRKTFPETLVTAAMKPRMMRVLPRGNWMSDAGDVVTPNVPAFLPQIQAERATRLDLAKWLVSKENPLTARVMVNRFWAMFFGQGLVKSLDDFGAQGTWPTHPELLDALAVDFRDAGWDVKRLCKSIVMSGAYRQSSRGSEAARQHDPFNQWLARQGRYRLDAEFVRDQALFVSGLLVNKLGGPSAKPYQPAGYWSFLNFPKREYPVDHDENQYRRGLYTYWCRTFPHPSLVAFDAPSREECTVARTRSNTPLQALVLLNDPTYVEAARVLAERAIQDGGGETAARIDYLFRRCLSRPPRDAEVALLTALVDKHLAEYRADAAAAAALLKIGDRPAKDGLDRAELAAWTNVCRAIFNMHEMIMRN